FLVFVTFHFSLWEKLHAAKQRFTPPEAELHLRLCRKLHCRARASAAREGAKRARRGRRKTLFSGFGLSDKAKRRSDVPTGVLIRLALFAPYSPVLKSLFASFSSEKEVF
ncbi:MAG: hypothetical protein IJR89_01150, partial [Clostridia bacterium]|nr:hypothetical protein [Clostridia bacterium]